MLRSHVFTRFNWSAIRFGKCNLSDNQCHKTRDKESTRNGIHCNRERIGERLAQLSTVLPGFLYLFPQLQGEGKKWEGHIHQSPHLPFQHTGNRDFSFLIKVEVFKPRHLFCSFGFFPPDNTFRLSLRIIKYELNRTASTQLKCLIPYFLFWEY